MVKFSRYVHIAILVSFAVFSQSCILFRKESGRISEDTAWRGRVVLEGDVYVEPGVLLDIGPGCRISYSSGRSAGEIQRLRNFDGSTYDLFDPSRSELIVAGELTLRGEEKAPVEFSSSSRNMDRAGGLSIIGTGGRAEISFLRQSGANTGIRVYDSRKLIIRDSVISDNSAGGLGAWDRSSVSVSSSGFISNKYGMGVSDMAKIDASRCRVSNNRASGIFCEGLSSGTVSSCRITGNNVGLAAGDSTSVSVVRSSFSANGCGLGCWDESRATVENNYMDSNIVGMILADRSTPLVIHNMLVKNGSGMSCIDESSGSVRNNSIHRSGPGIITSGKSSVIITENDLFGNRYGVLTEGESSPEIKKNSLRRNRVGILITENSKPRRTDNRYDDNLSDLIDNRL
jgi:nitrous oxidase accessory protein NosD